MGSTTNDVRSEILCSNSNGSQKDSETTDNQKRRRERKKKNLEQGNALKNSNCHTAKQGKKITVDAKRAIKEGQVYLIKNNSSNSTSPAESCQQSCVYLHEESGAAQTHVNSILSTRESSPLDASMNCSHIKKSKGGNKKEKENALRDNDVGFHIDAGVAANCDAMHVSEAEGSKLMNMAEQSVVSSGDNAMVQRVETDKADATMSKTQNFKSKKRKRIINNTVESGSVQNFLERSNGEDMEHSDRNADQEFASKQLGRKKENSVTSEKSDVQNLGRANLEIEKNKTTKVDEDAFGAEGACTLGDEKRKKKRSEKNKYCADFETVSVESKVGVDVNTVSGTSGGNLPRCTCHGHCSKKLLVLELNGILVDVVQDYHGKPSPDGITSGRSVFRRPFLSSFLEFCFKRFDVGIWSSSSIELCPMINLVMRNFASRLLFRMDSEKCTKTRFKTLENGKNPLVLKDLRRVWDQLGTCGSCKKQKYDETNTLLVDNSPYQALSNPPHTGIFPHLYHHTDREDSALGLDGILRLYLERLADAENVQKFVQENPFGEPAISESHESWEFYSKVIQRHVRQNPRIDHPKHHETVRVESNVGVEVKTTGESICGNSSVKDEEREGENIPRCKCRGHPSKKLLVLDLNGILADVVKDYRGKPIPDGIISGRSVFRRPFLSSFLEFCFERFDVGIWSSRRIGLYTMINLVMQNFASRLLFRMDRKKCTKTNFQTLENGEKPLVLKDLRRVWDRVGTCRSCRKQKYDETNTLLIDDSPYKALSNPPHTGIFPHPYSYTDGGDSALGPDSDLRLYLERLADAEDVQKFVKENPFGEPAISESHESWEFYSKVIQCHVEPIRCPSLK